MSRNPARARPLSANVKRLMRLSRAVPNDSGVEKVARDFTNRDLAYCDLQGSIFMAAADKGLAMSRFAPMYMNSQLAGVVDYSFSVAGGMEEDNLSNYLRVPLLLKSPALIVDTVVWLDEIVRTASPYENVNLAIVRALENGPENEGPVGDATEPSRDADTVTPGPDAPESDPPKPDGPPGSEANNNDAASDDAGQALKTMTDEYEYAYWLGYIYRCECLMHEESSRMVYGAFSEAFMHDFYEKLAIGDETNLVDCAPEICRRLDALLVGRLWK